MYVLLYMLLFTSYLSRCVVNSGVVWCSVVWCGVVWCGVWCGETVLKCWVCGVVQCCVVSEYFTRYTFLHTYAHNVQLNVHSAFCRSTSVLWLRQSYLDWHQEGYVHCGHYIYYGGEYPY